MADIANPIINLDYTSLPSAPHVLIRLIDLCHKNEVSFEELEAVIITDAALCTKVITISNSAAFGQWNDIRDLKRILVVLGTETIRSIALKSAVHQFFSQFSEQLGETLGSLWLDALICAHLTRQLASLTGYEYPEEAYLTGLIHQLGQLVLLTRDPQKYQQIMASVSDQSALLNKEQQLYGKNSAELGGEIIDQWDVGPILADAVRYQYKPANLLQDTQVLIKLLNLSSQLCNRLNHSNREYLVEDHFFGLNQPIIDNLIEQATAAAISDAGHFGIKVNRDLSIPRANIDDESIRLVLARKIRQIALLEGVQQHASSLDDVSDTMILINENLQLLFGLASTMFFFPDREQSKLTGIASHSKNRPAGLDLTVQIREGRSLISEAAMSGQLYTSRFQDLFEELTVIDQQVLSALGSTDLICLPLNHDNKLIGVIAIGCNADQAAYFHSDNELLNHFSKIVAESFARQQKLSDDRQQQRDQKQQKLDIQTRRIIHEVNNPLTVINNYLEVLLLDMEQDSENKQHVETIKAEVNRIGEIILQLKADPIQKVDDQTRVDVNELIVKLIDLFKPTFYKLNNIDSQLILDPELPEISIDQNRLKQIITNLVKNAAEALVDKGIIKIKTRALVVINREQYIEISIADNGDGLSKDILNKLFSPVKSTKDSTHSGLGLTIVNKLVSELGGLISYSKSDLGGAEFIIHLPMK